MSENINIFEENQKMLLNVLVRLSALERVLKKAGLLTEDLYVEEISQVGKDIEKQLKEFQDKTQAKLQDKEQEVTNNQTK